MKVHDFQSGHFEHEIYLNGKLNFLHCNYYNIIQVLYYFQYQFLCDTKKFNLKLYVHKIQFCPNLIINVNKYDLENTVIQNDVESG